MSSIIFDSICDLSNIIDDQMGSKADSLEFARAFGDALAKFLVERGVSQSDAAKKLLLDRPGKSGGKARLSTYCRDSRMGTRPTPNAELLYRVCTEFGFNFEYRGFRISATDLGTPSENAQTAEVQQLVLDFDGQYELKDQKGTISVRVKRPTGRVEISVSLDAAI